MATAWPRLLGCSEHDTQRVPTTDPYPSENSLSRALLPAEKHVAYCSLCFVYGVMRSLHTACTCFACDLRLRGVYLGAYNARARVCVCVCVFGTVGWLHPTHAFIHLLLAM